MKIVFSCLLWLNCLTLSAQVNLQTGSPEQNFPLINYTDARRGLSLGVSLDYAGGNGIQVQDVASNVGTGWNLNTGGFITRLQRGQPDDQPENLIYQNPKSFYNYPPGYLYNSNTGKGCNSGLYYYPVFKNQSEAIYKDHNDVLADQEQDRFVFNFNGKSGMFVIGKNFKAVTIGQSKTKIDVEITNMNSSGIRTTISGFTVTSEDGLKYTFREILYNRLMRYRHAKWNADKQDFDLDDSELSTFAFGINFFAGFPLDINERPYVVDTWCLSEIENTNNHEKIFFEYDQVVEKNTISGKSLSHTRTIPRKTFFQYTDNPRLAEGQTELISTVFTSKPINITYLKSERISKRLNKIILSSNEEISFKYSDRQRVDLSGESALEEVGYYVNGARIRYFQFTYGYLFKNRTRNYNEEFSSGDKKVARLCLLSLLKKGTDIDNSYEPPYIFSYFLGTKGDDIVPGTNFMNLDYFGYYNGSNSGVDINMDQDFATTRAQWVNALTPSKRAIKSNYAKNGLLKEIHFPTGGIMSYEYQQNSTNWKDGAPISTSLLSGGVSVLTTTLFDGNTHAKDIIKTYKYINSDGKSSRWGDENASYFLLSETGFTPNVNEHYNYTGIEFPELTAATPSFMSSMVKSLPMQLTTIFINTVLTQSFASIMGVVNPVLTVIAVINILVQNGKDQYCYMFTLTNTNSKLSNSIGNQFSRVEVEENSSSGTNGKIIYEFSDWKNKALLSPVNIWPYIPYQRTMPWTYGLPINTIVKNSGGQIISTSENKYNFIQNAVSDLNNQPCFCFTSKKIAQRGEEWLTKDDTHFGWNLPNKFIPRPYSYTTGRSELLSTLGKKYNNNNLISTNNISIVNDPQTLLQKGEILLKDNDKLIITSTYFPTDYDIAGPLQTLKDRNIIHLPVASETWMRKINSTPNDLYLINSKITEYKAYTFNNASVIKPWRTFELTSSEPVPISVIGKHDRNVLIRKPELFTQTNEFIYDADGDLTETITPSNRTTTLYNYHKNYTVAQVLNADYTDVSYTSFEGDSHGGWTFDNLFVNNNYNPVTGRKIFSLNTPSNSSSVITRGQLDVNKTYILTYWKRLPKNPDAVKVNDGAGELIFEYDDWGLIKHTVSNTSSISITGLGDIDELRLYPKGAFMTTNCYEEGIGKSDECDANNRLIFYEYDALGRLRLVRDQFKNIIKTYEYNYKQ